MAASVHGAERRIEKSAQAFRTISEVAAELDVPQHVLRFWETRFNHIKPLKRGGGRRYYRPDDIDLLKGIRHLLYGEGYTIRGVQRILREQGLKFVQAVWHPGAPQPVHGPAEDNDFPPEETAEPTRAVVSSEGDQSRGLFGLLPSLLGEAPPASSELRPTALPKVPLPGSINAPAPGTVLSPEDLRRLQAALRELSECRRLIDQTFDAKA